MLRLKGVCRASGAGITIFPHFQMLNTFRAEATRPETKLSFELYSGLSTEENELLVVRQVWKPYVICIIRLKNNTPNFEHLLCESLN